jgi:hypothetical protein
MPDILFRDREMPMQLPFVALQAPIKFKATSICDITFRYSGCHQHLRQGCLLSADGGRLAMDSVHSE